MPELPEVETVRRTLSETIIGRQITSVELHFPKILRDCEPDSFCPGLLGRSIQSIDRRGKFLLLRLDDGMTLVVHLGMTGKFFYLPQAPDEGYTNHTHAVWTLDDGGILVYHDPRQFGRLTLAEKPEEIVSALRTLGPEPLGKDFTLGYLSGFLKGRKGKLKQLLLDQKMVAGIGNIYADEILYDSRIHPERRADSLNGEETARLYRSIRKILKKGIAHRGSSISDYVDGHGVPGEFQKLLKAYGREGEPCPQCGQSITRIQVAGRSSHFCGRCQQ